MSESIGARLRQARELRHLTLPQVSETTKLRTHYLQALENDDYSAIPSAAQARGFLRIYADFLELDLAELLPAAVVAEPVSPAPAAAQAGPSQAVAAPANFLDGLRKRFARPKKEEAGEPELVSAPAGAVAEASDGVPATASSQAQTTRRPKKADSPEVKKNAVS